MLCGSIPSDFFTVSLSRELFLRRQHSARLARKIIRAQLRLTGGVSPEPPCEALPDDPLLLLAHVQQAMESCARLRLTGDDRELDRHRLPQFGPTFPLSSENIACVCTSYDGRDFAILRDYLDPASFARSLRLDLAFWMTRPQPPVFSRVNARGVLSARRASLFSCGIAVGWRRLLR